VREALFKESAAHHRFAMLLKAKAGSGRRVGSSLERNSREIVQQQVRRRCLREGSRDHCWWWCWVVVLRWLFEKNLSEKSVPAVERGLTEDLLLPCGFALQQQGNRRGCAVSASSIRYSLVKGNDLDGVARIPNAEVKKETGAISNQCALFLAVWSGMQKIE